MSLVVRNHIKPKSDQLNYDDFVGGDQTVQIANVTEGDSEHPIWVFLNEYDRPYKPCKSMLRILVAIWGDDAHEWIGKWLTLYANHDVKFGGVKVGGIRISHASDIERDLAILTTTTRSKRAPYLVKKLVIQGVTEEQKTKIMDLINATATDVSAFFGHFKVEGVNDFKFDDAAKAIKMLETKLAKQGDK